jgi:Negative regulator of sigma F
MMDSHRSTEEIVARLVDGIEPVRPVPAVRWQVMRVAAVWVATAALVAVWMGMHPLAILQRSGVSAGIALALALVGFAGLTLGLALRIPGRERLAGWAAVGIAGGLGTVALIGLLLPGSVADAGSLAECMNCTAHSLLLAIPSGLIAMAVALRGAGWRPALTGLGLASGATSLGALLVHTSCPSESPWHWLVAHALLPVLAGIPIGMLAAWVFDRVAKRSARAAAERIGG